MTRVGPLKANGAAHCDGIPSEKNTLTLVVRNEIKPVDLPDESSTRPTPTQADEQPETFNHEINQELHAYALGDKLRQLRLKKSMALVRLGQRSGLSPSMVCKLERGKALPTLPTLLRISRALGVDLEYFFHGLSWRPVSIVRRSERMRFRDVANSSYSYAFESLNFLAPNRQFNVFWAEFQPLTGKPRTHQHDGVEFLYVLEGEMAIRVGAEEHRLHTGDTIYFESTTPHSYRRLGTNSCQALVVLSQVEENIDMQPHTLRLEHLRKIRME